MSHFNVIGYRFTIQELRALARYLEHQYINYEDAEVLAVVRKISRIVENDAQLVKRDSLSTQGA